MASGEAGGKKRKASVAEDVTSPARREPRRGLGVAELERIRVALEMAERCYAAVASSWSLSTPHQPPRPALPPAAAALVVHHAAGVAAAPAAHHQHQHVGNNGAVHQLQMARAYLTPYYLAQHYYGNDSLTRLFATNGGHPSSHQNHYRQADQIQSAVAALPVTGQAASSENSSSASQRRQGHRRAHAKPAHTTLLPQVSFVDLVDSDDDNGGDVAEVDLELKL
ncbi:hypothetical protein BDA96_01G522600 [Sorghum bicolor]|uniref:Uncharacterized protein n=1 Tax=Sorghum bicolor TaxID=4558 RepID=A0A921S5R0_SORBI|nr:hypothetical protein BDA96_01G522600 [Sorghum bicolor]